MAYSSTESPCRAPSYASDFKALPASSKCTWSPSFWLKGSGVPQPAKLSPFFALDGTCNAFHVATTRGLHRSRLPGASWEQMLEVGATPNGCRCLTQEWPVLEPKCNAVWCRLNQISARADFCWTCFLPKTCFCSEPLVKLQNTKVLLNDVHQAYYL